MTTETYNDDGLPILTKKKSETHTEDGLPILGKAPAPPPEVKKKNQPKNYTKLA